MKILKADCKGRITYKKIFMDITGLTSKEYWALLPHGKQYPRPGGYTERLTDIRKALINSGYSREVQEADDRYLAEHHGFSSEEAWEAHWQKFYADADVPEDAL